MSDTLLIVVFGVGLGAAFATYFVYPTLMGLAAWARPRPLSPTLPPPASVTVILAARNEAGRVGGRIEELLASAAEAAPRSDLVIVSDGSTDATAAEAGALAERYPGRVKIIEWASNRGKAAALTEAAGQATGEVLVFADARQRWLLGAVRELMEPFRDPNVGAVSGQLSLEESPGVLAGVGLYWRFEKWLRESESAVGSQVGVTGAIAAVRRSLFRPIPDGVILDDVYWPMQVSLQHRRVVYAPGAVAIDRLPPRIAGEFRRKVRTLVGNFQLIAFEPRLLVPGLNPLWAPFVWHKLMRLVCPWGVLAGVSAALALGRLPYLAVAYAVLAAAFAAAVGLVPSIAVRSRLLGSLGALLLLQVAAGSALIVWLSGSSGRLWSSSAYDAEAKGSVASPNVSACDDA